ncbi:MAG: DUF4440 domain-containing protein [Gemmatimonadetes bacterium]|nr:DUF4440 domain-containing protein [Gemmatimonadota bacterium]
MISIRSLAFALLAVCWLCSPSAAQEAAPEDVASIDAIITASYDVISGSADEQRDWDRERSLFHPDSRHMPTYRAESGEWIADVTDVEGFIERADRYFSEQSFYEYEIARRVERFGNIAHVFSTYEWSHEQGGPTAGRGINSFQLLFDGTRWWILSVFWQQESEDYPIPSEYLPE